MKKYEYISMYIKAEDEVKLNLFAYHRDLLFHHFWCKENIEIFKLIALIEFAFKLLES